MRLSIILPVLNEEENMERVLHALSPLLTENVEVIVADGGSTDRSVGLAIPLCHQVIHCERGRAAQMNAGAAASSGDVLLFLHADTLLPANAYQLVCEAIGEGKHLWGRFDVKIEGAALTLKIVSLLMNLRSRLTGIATGDQAMFVRRDEFLAVGGFPHQALMEDIEISSRLKRRSAPALLSEHVTTSGRRWEQRGVWRTIFLMWRLRLMYWFGAAPEELAKAYR